MAVTAFYLLLWLSLINSGQARVSLVVTPKRLQFLKYDSFSVSCEEEDEEESVGWTVMKKMEDGEVRPCLSLCSITAAFPTTDSGLYWCETGLGLTSDAVIINVTVGSVILDSPVHSVAEGNDVILQCRSKIPRRNFTASFYKDGRLIRNSSTGNMTIVKVSKADEGVYRCSIYGYGQSPQSWLTVRAHSKKSTVSTVPPADHVPSASSTPVFTVVRHLVVVAPYLLSTIILGLIYRSRVKTTVTANRTLDDVIMEVVT
ncbi:low affinity immunoglobulin gamma Fc region receptor II-a-like [Thalassophryne amazonica]|uniref:low affinity immunoglobulin gamma Fc region receptor II-a-like n=1 Tax=Thalassophryne amazonica TaxID=390379 RepID=UPI0014726B17|nr:low affinity immunoglobulin gamma Fc region receptor II-a-like [Thalassophryne amazonica]